MGSPRRCASARSRSDSGTGEKNPAPADLLTSKADGAQVALMVTVGKSRSATRRFGLVAVTMAAAAVLASCGTSVHPGAIGPLTFHVPPTPTVNLAVTAPPGTTLVATLHGDTQGSATPGGPATQVVPGEWYGYQSILP